MANRRFVTSFGSPYVAFTAENVGDRTAIPAFGIAAMTAEFRVEALPVQSASADELHAFFAFDHDLQTQRAIFEVGVTPSGRVKATCITGSSVETGVGLISDGSTWHTLQVVYDGGSGDWTLSLDGNADVTAVDGSPAYLIPNAGYQSRLMLYNGRDALARTGVSIRNASATFVGNLGTVNVTWDFHEGQGAILTPTVVTTGGEPFASTAVAAARYYDPLISHPWGAIPADPPNGTYRWGLTTDWTQLALPTTTWTEVVA